MDDRAMPGKPIDEEYIQEDAVPAQHADFQHLRRERGHLCVRDLDAPRERPAEARCVVDEAVAANRVGEKRRARLQRGHPEKAGDDDVTG